MRRVVVTGMGIACPLGVGVAHVWKRLIEGESGIAAIQSFDTAELTAKIAGQVPPGTRADGRAGPRRVDPGQGPEEDGPLHPPGHGRGQRGGRGSRLGAADRGGSLRHRRDDRLRHRRPADHLRGVRPGHPGQGAAAVAVLHPGLADQPRVRPRFDQVRLQGAEPLRRHRLRHRRARRRRRRAADHAGRRRRDGGGRGRGGGQPAGHRRVLRRPRAVDRLQRPPAAGQPALGPRPRRLRDGRGRRRAGARGTGARQGARAPRSTPRCAATACPATRTTSRPRPRATRARSAP